MRVVERSRWETRVRANTIGMYVPKSPTEPLSSEDRVVFRLRGLVRWWYHRWGWWLLASRGVVVLWEASSMVQLCVSV